MYKMLRKFVYISLLFGIAFTGWIYWKCNAELNEALITLKRKLNIIKDVSLQPFPTTCKSYTFLVIIVISYVGNLEVRSAHRRIIPTEELRKINAIRVFLLAQIPDNEKHITQSAINNESKTYGDILQGTFVENYRILTHKHLMGLKWASTTCQKASFILKVDDDTVYNLQRVYELLNSIYYSKDLIIGYVINNTKPRRNKDNKWYVTWEEYPRQEYPTYLSGWYYITTPHVAAALCNEAIYHHPYFWIEDIFVTGILTESLEYKLHTATGSCYKHHKKRRSWVTAHKICAAEGAHLLIINDQKEADAIKNDYLDTPTYGGWGEATHIGLRDWNGDHTWLSIHGEKIENLFNKWAEGQPDQKGFFRCGLFWGKCTLDDVACDEQNALYSFICEKDPHTSRFENISEKA